MTRQTTRTRLLDATDELVLAGGATHAPVDRILERAGVSPATLYRAYESREALVAAALERRHGEWLEVWDAAVARHDDATGRLLAVFEALDEFATRDTGARWCAFLATAAGYPDPPPALAAAVRLESTSLRGRLRELAEPVVGARADQVTDALVLLVSGQLAVRLRPGAPPAPGTARALAALLLDRPGGVSGRPD